MESLNHKLNKEEIAEYMKQRKGSISKDITKPKTYSIKTIAENPIPKKPTKKMIGTHRTTISTESNLTFVRYHNTYVVRFSPNWIVLDSGGYRTYTTKKRMNQTSQVYDLGYKVYQKDYDWFVDHKGKTIEYNNNQLILDR